MKPLTEAEMKKIADEGSASTLNPTHKKQFMIFIYLKNMIIRRLL